MIYQNENFGGNYVFRSRRHDGYEVCLHLHEYSEILYVINGCAEVKIDNKKIAIPKNHLIFIPPNITHEYMCKNTDVVCAVFSNDFIPIFFKTLGNRSIITKPIDFSDLSEMAGNIYRSDPDNHILLSGYLNIICNKILQESDFRENSHNDNSLYQKVISYLSQHYTENITLKDIAKKFGYNEKYLSYLLHDLSGINFRKLLSMYRVEYAKTLLNKKENKISTIAMDCGFSSLSTFNREFKFFVGKTPSSYKTHH